MLNKLKGEKKHTSKFFRKEKSFMILDGLSENTVNSLLIDGIVSKYTELHENYIGDVPKSKEKIIHRIRQDLILASFIDKCSALKFFEAISEDSYCFTHGFFVFIIRNNTVIDVTLLEQNKKTIKKIKAKNKTRNKSEPEIDLSRVQFSQHALERFKERSKIYESMELFNPEERVLQLLSKATEENAISKDGKVKRIISNKFEEARYFICGKWRFVIIEQQNGMLLVKTIEWDYFH